MSMFRAHGHPATFQPLVGSDVEGIKFIDHHGIEVMGERDEIVVVSDAVEVMVSTFPDYEIGDQLLSGDDSVVYELGRVVKDDGYFRLIEVTIQ